VADLLNVDRVTPLPGACQVTPWLFVLLKAIDPCRKIKPALHRTRHDLEVNLMNSSDGFRSQSNHIAVGAPV